MDISLSYANDKRASIVMKQNSDSDDSRLTESEQPHNELSKAVNAYNSKLEHAQKNIVSQKTLKDIILHEKVHMKEKMSKKIEQN